MSDGDDIDPTAAGESGDAILLSYRRLAGGSGTTGDGYSMNGIQYFAEVATDLATWGTASASVTVDEVGTPTDNGDGTETVTLRLHTGAVLPGSGRWFVRVTVTEVP